MKRKKLLYLAPLGILGVLAFIALGGEIVRLLWNALLPPLFGWREITFWQALGLLVLCRILFGSMGLHGSGQSKMRRHMEERWEAMPPEERERLRQRMRDRCGLGSAPSEARGENQPPMNAD